MKRPYFPIFVCHSLCFELFISVLRLFAFYALAFVLKHFICKHCLEILGLSMRRVT